MDVGAQEDDEEKYAKARRQRRRTWVVLLGMMTLMTGGATVTWQALQQQHAPTDNALSEQQPDDLASLVQQVEELDAEVRRIKKTGVIMEADPVSLAATQKLQEATRELLKARYGYFEPYRVKIVLEFQPQSPEFATKGPHGSILLEMAPRRLQPHSVYMFLEIARHYQGGGFHRIARHVLQVMVRGGRRFPSLAFQEYSDQWPHQQGTVGYAGRPSGPGWYISIQDNVRNHGPGSQQKHNPYEADSCFGRVIAGYNDEVQRIAKIPEQGFLKDPKKHVLIREMQILVPGNGPDAVDGFVLWKDRESSSADESVKATR